MDWGKLMSQHELNILNQFRIELGSENSAILYDLVGIAIAAEREACAAIADDRADESHDMIVIVVGTEIAAAIRARGEK